MGVTGLVLVVLGSWIPAKAVLAQVLIEQAWLRSMAENKAVKPWPWMDTWPVGRLRVPEHGVSLIAMSGTSGQALAFGPGLQSENFTDNTSTVVMAGHNDTHFGFLEDLKLGSRIQLELPAQTRHFTVSGIAVMDVRDGPAMVEGSGRLVLITCYPFSVAATNGPLRYVVTAMEEGSTGKS